MAELDAVKIGVDAVAGNQRVMRPLFGDDPVLQHDDLIAIVDRFELL